MLSALLAFSSPLSTYPNHGAKSWRWCLRHDGNDGMRSIDIRGGTFGLLECFSDPRSVHQILYQASSTSRAVIIYFLLFVLILGVLFLFALPPFRPSVTDLPGYQNVGLPLQKPGSWSGFVFGTASTLGSFLFPTRLLTYSSFPSLRHLFGYFPFEGGGFFCLLVFTLLPTCPFLPNGLRPTFFRCLYDSETVIAFSSNFHCSFPVIAYNT